MADGTQVWVCKECGTENLPGETQPVDAAAAQAAVNQAASAAPAAPASTPGDMPSGQGPTSGQPAM